MFSKSYVVTQIQKCLEPFFLVQLITGSLSGYMIYGVFYSVNHAYIFVYGMYFIHYMSIFKHHLDLMLYKAKSHTNIDEKWPLYMA